MFWLDEQSIKQRDTQQSFLDKILNVPVPNMIHKITSNMARMPQSSGRTLRFRRYSFEIPETLLDIKSDQVFKYGQAAYHLFKEQDNNRVSFVYMPPQYGGPLATDVTVGYKFNEVPRILNDKWLVNLRTEGRLIPGVLLDIIYA